VVPRQWARQAIVQPCLFVGVCEIDREQVAFQSLNIASPIALLYKTEVRGSFVIPACTASSSLTYLKLTSRRLYVKCKAECVRKLCACFTRRRYSLKCIPHSSELQIYARKSTFFDDSRFFHFVSHQHLVSEERERERKGEVLRKYALVLEKCILVKYLILVLGLIFI